MLVTAGIGVALPLVTENFYGHFRDQALDAFIVLGGLFLLEYVNRIGYQLSTYKYVQNLLGETRARTYALWLRAPLKVKRKGVEDEFPLGEVLARIMTDTDAVKELVTSGAFGIFIDVIFILSALVGFLRIDGQIGLGLVVIEVVAALGLVWGSRKMVSVFALVRQSQGMLSRVLTDITQGLRELAFTPHARYASLKGDRASDDFLEKQLKANVWDASYYSLAESLYPVLLALVLVIFPQGGGARLALLAVLIDLIQKSISPIKEIAGKISSIQRARTGVERIHEFQEHFAHAEVKSEGTDLGELRTFELALTEFSYPERQGQANFSLRDIHFQAGPGELVGLVGISGCGKSTLLKLLSGQHGAFAGVVRVNGQALQMDRPEDLLRLCRLVSLVSQDSHVFSADLGFNITLGERTAEFEDFWAEASRRLSYLGRWGVTPETVIKPKELSLGQKQLLSGLRACFLKKPVVLFDEVSSGLDPDLERALRELVLMLQAQSLTIIVTHRLETILNAQQVVLLDAGRLVDRGPARELQARSVLFREFLAHL